MNHAQKAVELVRKLFADAHKRGCLDDVWHLATALRGPDTDGAHGKMDFTTPLRQALLSRHVARDLGVAGSGTFSYRPRIGELPGMEPPGCPRALPPHWWNHTRFAIQVLQDSQGKEADHETKDAQGDK